MPGSKPSSFVTDVFKLVTGTTLAQVIVVAASPLLTRLYGPEAYGFAALFASIISIIGVIACMRYELAIMLPRDDKEAANLLGLSLFCAVGISGLTVLALFLGGDALLSLLNAPDLAPYLPLVPLFILINGVFLALNYWNSRTKHFSRLSVSRVISSLATTGTQLGAGFAGLATGGSLIGANLVGSSVSTTLLGGGIWRDDNVLLRKSISWSGMLDGLKRYKKFPLIDSWSALLNTISWQLPVILFAFFFSPSVVGYYSLGFTVLQMPMSLIGGAISQVFFQRAASAHSEGNLPLIVENVFNVLFVLGIFPTVILALIGSDIFSLVFGATWTEAGLYAQILSIWAFVWFISSPLSILWAVLEKQEFGIKVTLLNLITRLVSLFIGGKSGEPIIALILFAISGIFVYGYLNVKMLIFSGVMLKQVMKDTISNIIPMIPIGTLLLVLKMLNIEPFLLVITSVLLGLIYYLYIYWKDPRVNFLLNMKGT